MKEEKIKRLYLILNENLENCEDIINNECDDIDCSKFKYAKELRNPYNIISHASCVKKAKSEKEIILEFLKEKRFNRFRYKKCCVCKKKLDTLSKEYHIEMITKKLAKSSQAYFFIMHAKCKKKWNVKKYSSE